MPGAGLGTGWVGGSASPVFPVSRTLRMTNETNKLMVTSSCLRERFEINDGDGDDGNC